MHIYFATRGNKDKVDKMITQLQGKWLPIKLKVNAQGKIDKDGVEQDMLVNLSVRPLQIWEIAIPEEHKDLTLNTLLKGNKPYREQKEYRIINKMLTPFRKLLGIEPVIDYDKKNNMPLETENVDIFILGTKKDRLHEWGEGI